MSSNHAIYYLHSSTQTSFLDNFIMSWTSFYILIICTSCHFVSFFVIICTFLKDDLMDFHTALDQNLDKNNVIE